MIDIADAIRDYLIQPSPLFSLTSTRIWGEMVVPPPGYTPANGAMVVFATRGGTTGYEGLLRPRIQFKCYGPTPTAANTCYRALYDRLHEAKSGVFRMALSETLGQPLQEQSAGPNGGWHFVLTFFRFVF
jgi:hypothetical protein